MTRSVRAGVMLGVITALVRVAARSLLRVLAGPVLYRSDPDDLWPSIARGQVAAGFFLPPMSTAGFAGAIAHV